MKTQQFLFAFIFLFAIGFVLQSCTNDELPEMNELAASENNNTFSLDDIRFENGMMVFDDYTDFEKAAEQLRSGSVEKLTSFESQNDFHSLKKKIDSDFVDLFSNNSSFANNEFFQKDDDGPWYIDFPFYFLSAALNQDGFVKVGSEYLKYTKGYTYTVEESAYSSGIDLESYKTSKPEQGVYVAAVKYYTDSDLVNEVDASSEIEARADCENYDSGVVNEGQIICDSRKGGTTGNGPVTWIRVQSISWSVNLTGPLNEYRGRTEAVVNTYYATNNAWSLLSTSCSAGIFHSLKYWMHNQGGSNILNLFSVTSPTVGYSHMFTVWECSGIECYADTNCYSYSPFHALNTFGLNSYDGYFPNINYTPSNINVSIGFTIPGSTSTGSASCQLAF